MAKEPKQDPRKAPQKDAEAGAEEEKKSSKWDPLFWVIILAAGGFFLSGRFARTAELRWKPVLEWLQVGCFVVLLFFLIVSAVLLFKTHRHPLRSFNQKLAAERSRLRRESQRKKAKKRGF